MPKNYTTLLAEAFRSIEEVMARIEDILNSIQQKDSLSDRDLRSVAEYIRDPRVVEPLMRVRARIIQRSAAYGDIDNIHNELETLETILSDMQYLYKKIREKNRKK